MAMIAAREGRGPNPLNDRPELDPALQHVWQGFWQLSAGRGVTEAGVQAIRTEAILAWFEIHGHTDLEEREQLLDWLLTLDGEYLRWARERSADGHALPRAER